MGNKTFSQWGQDLFVDRIVYSGKRHGVFVDIGAHDGITFSNSYFFETFRQWSGVCVEPLPDRFAELVANRRCACINKAVASSATVATFTVVEGSDMLSGLTDGLSQEHLARIARASAESNTRSVLISVNCDTVGAMLREANISDIDLLSIDVEGLEIQVLQTIEFDKHRVGCITVEDNARPGELQAFLRDRGFQLLARLGGDCVFVHSSIGWMPATRYRVERVLKFLREPRRWLPYGRRLISRLATKSEQSRG